MRGLYIIAGLAFFPLMALNAPSASAGGNEFCSTGTVSGSKASINCAKRWVATNGAQLGQVPDPRHTPKTPYTSPHSKSSKIWSGSSDQWSGGESHNSSRVWHSRQPHTIPPQVHVIRGGHQGAVYSSDSHYSSDALLGANTHQSGSTIVTSSAGHYSGCGHESQQTVYNSHNISSGCFSYDQHGTAQPTACPANVASSQSWAQQSHISVLPIIERHHTSSSYQYGYQDLRLAQNNAFFATLNGGVGTDGGVFYGGGGGYGYSSVGGSVLGQAPLLRFGGKRKGGGKKGGKGDHGGKGGCCKGGMGKGGSSHGGGGH